MSVNIAGESMDDSKKHLLSSCLLDYSDIESIYSTNPDGSPIFNVKSKYRDKLALFNPPINHVVDCRLFNTVYALSDIHSDFRKFVQILQNNNIVRVPKNPYKGEDIYDPAIICDLEWIAGPSVLLVIVGDLVDGARNFGLFLNKPDDERGSFEILLHAFIYNMRIKSQMVNSEVLFTIGNHDATTVLTSYHLHEYDIYVSTEANKFFKYGVDNNIRINALIDFYRKSPYLFLSLERPETSFTKYFRTIKNHIKKEVAFVHGGLHGNNGEDMTNELNEMQQRINRGQVDIRNLGMIGGIWSRFYAMNKTEDKKFSFFKQTKEQTMCSMINKSEYKIIVVGHCPTTVVRHDDTISEIAHKPEYDDCDKGTGVLKKGCIMMACVKPKVIFVDSALGKGQRFPQLLIDNYPKEFPNMKEINNSERKVEILKLSRGHKKEFYSIERILDGVSINFSKRGGKRSIGPRIGRSIGRLTKKKRSLKV